MKLPETRIQDLSFNISNYCISTCRYCTLCNPKNWNIRDEMSMEEVERVLKDPLLATLKTIHLTGGEPFLSPKFLPIIDIIADRYPKVPLNLPTNALYPQLIYRLMKYVMKKAPHLRLNIGIEGPNRKIHEAIRGAGSWLPAIETVSLLKILDVPMVFNMTLFRENYKSIRETKELATKWGVGFYLNFGRFSRRFGNSKDEVMWYIDDREELIREIEDAIIDIGWLKERRLNAQKWAIQKAKWRGLKVEWQCLAGIEGIDIYPDGRVYPCLMYLDDYCFGNIKDVPSWSRYEPLRYLLETSSKGREIQWKIYGGDCSRDCLFTCQLRMKNLRIESKEIQI